MYGLEGNQTCIDWENIRGAVVVMRAEPPTTSLDPFATSPNFDDTLTRQEIIDTIKFFKNKNPEKVARQRDMERLFGSQLRIGRANGLKNRQQYAAGFNGNTIIQPKAVDKILKTQCTQCQTPSPMVKKLMTCPCKKAFYCGKKCQIAHWPIHKQKCAHKNAKNK